ncbi:MAG: serine/threonine protein kinase [Myxococcaceae bacterium]|nr:serine/threonine protein kinase [Myxococcaceae bacterium]
MTFAPGELIGERYRLEELIGSGGMGDVFRARDTLLERAVALKLVDVGDPRRREEIAKNFLREARISAAIAHRNVVQILDFGSHGGTIPFIVMELLEGESLADVLGRGERLSFDWIAELVQQLLEGLAAAHDAGVVHRDLKPENIYLVRSRTGVYPKILDFGISKLTDAQGAVNVTTTQGHVVGTPAYMSPEQARGVKVIDKRTDLYSMGVVMYELLSGEMPFFSENPGDVMVMIVTKPERPLLERVPGLPQALSDVVSRAMAKKPDERFSDARSMQSALQLASEELRKSPEVRELDRRLRPSSWRKRSLEPTEIEQPRAEVSAPSSARPLGARGKRVLLALLSLVLAGVALGVTVVALNRGGTPASRFILVHADQPNEPAANLGAEGEPTQTATAERASSTVLPATPVESRRDAAKRVEADPATRIADSFKRQKKTVVACVNEHYAEAERTPKLAVRIALEPGGSVQSAKVLPASVAGGTMGICIERAVRAMQFPRQTAALSFEVPLTTRKGE